MASLLSQTYLIERRRWLGPARSLILIAASAVLCACANHDVIPATEAPSLPPTTTQSIIPPPAVVAPPALDPPGPYWVMGKLCGEDDCDNIPGRWRALAPANLYAQPNAAAPVVGRLTTDEWVKAVEKRTRYTPQRGVVRTAGGGLSVGDVVYGPFRGTDEAHHQVWRNGKRITLKTESETPQINWGTPSPNAPTRVMWVRVDRATGPGGWLRDPGSFACMGEHPPSDENC